MASNTKPVNIYLDINIGDAAKHETAAAAYSRATAYLTACGSQLGLEAAAPEDLSDEGAALLQEAYAADPAWNTRGACDSTCNVTMLLTHHLGRRLWL
jgi:hypothetical protein